MRMAAQAILAASTIFFELLNYPRAYLPERKFCASMNLHESVVFVGNVWNA